MKHLQKFFEYQQFSGTVETPYGDLPIDNINYFSVSYTFTDAIDGQDDYGIKEYSIHDIEQGTRTASEIEDELENIAYSEIDEDDPMITHYEVMMKDGSFFDLSDMGDLEL
ncbi:MAG: hypothetical protein SLAVMIC_00311 [uncultured marine phage]|uniref:Uncharacterized protein n=1 Tax=uncultured marine phage TaxID=707152 RepID=A0A8D9FQN3_9VIRU|nr:MAG: hypothetical protein SLAVMIC_00311 [uncultured marine phage]